MDYYRFLMGYYYDPFTTSFWIGMAICAGAFFLAGKYEGKPGMLWGALSVLVWTISPTHLLLKIAGQVGLYVAIAVIDSLSESAKERRLEAERARKKPTTIPRQGIGGGPEQAATPEKKPTHIVPPEQP
jgi:hypothetical protein